ncbi:MAG: response regulator [Spirochaetota bacterium]
MRQALVLQPDLILLDVQMPVMNGLEATQKMRQHQALQKNLNRL